MNRLLLFLLLPLSALGQVGLTSKNLSTNYFQFLTNVSPYQVILNTNTNSAASIWVSNIAFTSGSPQVWTNGGGVLRNVDQSQNTANIDFNQGSIVIHTEPFDSSPVSSNFLHLLMLGDNLGQPLTNGAEIIQLGNDAGGSAANARDFIAIGHLPGSLAWYAHDVISIGHSAGPTTTGTNCVFIGNSAGATVQDGNNSIYIGLDNANQNAHQTNDVVIGYGTQLLGNRVNSLVLGANAVGTLDNQAVFGSGISNYVFNGVQYLMPATNGSAGQVIGGNGATPQQLYWTNLPAAGITGGTTNFATTNTDNGLTNAINSINTNFTTTAAFTNEIKAISTNVAVNTFSNQIPNWIHGRTNYVPIFSPNTNEVSASIMFQTNGTTDIGMRNGDSPDGTLALSFKMYGHYASEAARDWLDFKWVPGTGDYEIMTDKGSSGTTRSLAFGVGGTRYWNINTSGHLLPVSNNANDIGASSDGVHNIWVENEFIRDGNGDSTHPFGISAGASGASFYLGANQFGFMEGTGPTEYIRFDLGANPIRTLDIGVAALAGGPSGVGGRDTFLLRSGVGIWQVGTNMNSATLTTNRIRGAQGSGSNISASGLFLGGGAPTGTGTPGAVGFETATNGAAISTQAGYQTRTYISANPVTLTESSATKIFSVVLNPTNHVGMRILSTINADDSTDFQCLNETISISAVNKNTTITTSVSAATPSSTAASTGTLTSTWTAVQNGAAVDVKVSAVSSLTQTTLACRWRVELDGNGPLVITAQ